MDDVDCAVCTKPVVECHFTAQFSHEMTENMAIWRFPLNLIKDVIMRRKRAEIIEIIASYFDERNANER